VTSLAYAGTEQRRFANVQKKWNWRSVFTAPTNREMGQWRVTKSQRFSLLPLSQRSRSSTHIDDDGSYGVRTTKSDSPLGTTRTWSFIRCSLLS
jgi:hypothetical protein